MLSHEEFSDLMWGRMLKVLRPLSKLEYPNFPKEFVSPLWDLYKLANWDYIIQCERGPSSLIIPVGDVVIDGNCENDVWTSEIFHPYCTGASALIRWDTQFDEQVWRPATITETLCMMAQKVSPTKGQICHQLPEGIIRLTEFGKGLLITRKGINDTNRLRLIFWKIRGQEIPPDPAVHFRPFCPDCSSAT